MQVVRSPFTESQAVRSLKQAKMCAMLYHGRLANEMGLTVPQGEEDRLLEEITGGMWRSGCTSPATSARGRCARKSSSTG